jgi:hypothetical protein
MLLHLRSRPWNLLDELLGDQTFDAAIARATLHWLPREDHPALLRAVAGHLRPHGFLRAEFAGRGQMQQAVALFDDVSERFGGPRSPWFFPDADEYRELVVAARLDPGQGFVRLVPQRRSMPDFEALVGFLRSQAFVGTRPDSRPMPGQAFASQPKPEPERNSGARTGPTTSSSSDSIRWRSERKLECRSARHLVS